jgi:hypothetical protein
VLEPGKEVGDLVYGHACGDSSSRDSDSVAYEQVAVAARDVVEVDLAIERSTDGPHVVSSGCRAAVE